MEALYVNSNTFTVEGYKIQEFNTGRRVRIDCGDDGVIFSSVVSSSFSTLTTVVIDSSDTITTNITDVLFSVVKSGEEGNIPAHYHSSAEGDGGFIPDQITSFTGLSDSPTSYSGSEGMYSMSTGSGIIWAQPGSSNVNTFLDLSDTPSTYSGTEGLYAQSTGSGVVWSEVSSVGSFTELLDTPLTYSGTEGLYAQSTGSGVVWAAAGSSNVEILYSDFPPNINTVAEIDNLYIYETDQIVYKKNRDLDSIKYFAKSIIIDVSNTWGPNTWGMGIRSVEFVDLGEIISITSSDITCYGEYYSGGYEVWRAFDTSLSKIGLEGNNQWLENSSTPHRIICVFDSGINFTSIIINNAHNSGASTYWGAKDIKIYTSPSTITSQVYGQPISDGVLIFDGQILEHAKENVIDDQVLDSLIPLDAPDIGWDIVLQIKNNFIELNDTPSTYSETEGMFAQSTGSGVVWSEIDSSGVDSFIELNDTPSTYSGIEGNYLRTTSSGIEAVDGIILKAPDLSEWVLKVTNSGILYTEEVSYE